MIENSVIVYDGNLERVNCSFYMKMGACRHGSQCTKVHEKPLSSRTIVLKHLYLNPKFVFDLTTNTYFYSKNLTEDEIQEHFDNLFEDIFVECEDQYGEITDMVICENFIEHLRGNVYIKFNFKEDAEKAVKNLNNRWFGGRPVYAELSPVIQFHYAYCRALITDKCPKENMCNFWHVKKVSDNLFRKLKYGRKHNYWFLRFPTSIPNLGTTKRSQNLESSSQSSMPQLSQSYETAKRSQVFESRSQSSKLYRSRTRSSRDRSRSRSISKSSRCDINRSRSKSILSRRDRSKSRSMSKSRGHRNRSKSSSSRRRSKSKSRRNYKRSHSSCSSSSRTRSRSNSK